MNTKRVSNITYGIMEKVWDFNNEENMPRRSFTVDSDVYASAFRFPEDDVEDLTAEINRSLNLATTGNMYGRYIATTLGDTNSSEIHFLVVPDQDSLLKINKQDNGFVIVDDTVPHRTLKSWSKLNDVDTDELDK